MGQSKTENIYIDISVKFRHSSYADVEKNDS